MTWNTVMGLLSSIALFLPIVAIVALRLTTYRTFPALLFYYVIVFVYNLFTENYVSVDPSFEHGWGLMNNLLDTPLMLTFLTYFSPSALFTKRLHWVTAAFMLFEVIVVGIYGLNVDAITIILAPGILLTIAVVGGAFIRQTKITITHQKASGKFMITMALLFAYGCYGIIYLLYYIYDSQNAADSFLIYFFVTLLSSILLTIGLIAEHRRVNKLNELRITRKELSDVYGKDTKAVPVTRKVKLDFDKKDWNEKEARRNDPRGPLMNTN